jgi:hypothetical protein
MKVEGHIDSVLKNILLHNFKGYTLSEEETNLIESDLKTFFFNQSLRVRMLISLFGEPQSYQSLWYIPSLQSQEVSPEYNENMLKYLKKSQFVIHKQETQKNHLTKKGNNEVFEILKYFMKNSEAIQTVEKNARAYQYTPRSKPSNKPRSSQTNVLFSTIVPKNPDMYNRILEAYDEYIQTDDGPEEDLIQMADDMERALGIPFDQIPNLGDKIRIHMYTPIQMCKTSALKTNNTRTFNKIFGPLEQEIKKKK